MLKTHTGGFAVGVRRGWTEWQQDTAAFAAWAKANNIGVVDVGADVAAVKAVAAAGLSVGSADLHGYKDMLSPDKARRDDAVAKNAAHVQACAAAGVKNFFCVMVPEKPELKRAENFGYMVDSYARLAGACEKAGASIVVEGWPGPGALACTPEGYRALFKEVPSPAMAVNYDPSHLLRMGIDPIRFLGEFVSRVRHVHGKDTEILTENLYEYGTEQPPTFAKPVDFGGMAWRYTIPGHGCVRWHRAFWLLKQAGYQGAVSIELEDAHFNGTEEGEKRGILAGAQFLATC